MASSFSKRNGYQSVAPITIREDAPREVREALLMIAQEEGLTPSTMRATVCQILRKSPDSNNWTEYPNIWDEVESLVLACNWYRVYDIAEEFYRDINEAERRGRRTTNAESFERKVNEFFEEHGVALKFVDGLLQFRGDKGFEKDVADAKSKLLAETRTTAAGEIDEALRDLSRRPVPDRTGAVQHAMAGLECFVREVTGDKKTLGELLKTHKSTLGIPEPLHTAVEKAWGFASERGRHLKEGREPTAGEAELVVSICAALISFLTSKFDDVRDIGF